MSSPSSSSDVKDAGEKTNSKNETKRRLSFPSSLIAKSPLLACRETAIDALEKTKHARALIALCLREEDDEKKRRKKKKSTKIMNSMPLLAQLSLFVLLELSTQKASTETFKKSSQAWTSIAVGRHADAIRPILEHFLYFGLLARPLATSAGYVKVNVERRLAERATEAAARKLFERRRLLDLESVLDDDDDDCGKMKRSGNNFNNNSNNNNSGGNNNAESDMTMMLLRVLMEAEDIVAFGIPMACERACYAGFGLIESMIALAYHGRVLNMHFGREKCLMALAFAFTTARLKKRSEKRRGKRSEGGGGAEFVAKKARETVAVALRDARALSAPYALEEEGFDDQFSLLSSTSSTAKLNATSLLLFPNVQSALELVRRCCVDAYFSGSKSIALGAFISNWTVIASVLFTAKSEKPFGIGQACVAAITSTHNAFVKLEELFFSSADGEGRFGSVVLDAAETHCANVLKLQSVAEARDVHKFTQGDIEYRREDDGEINWAQKPILECKKLTLYEDASYRTANTEKARTKPLVESLDFELNAGELCCISGPSGCGKTTLLRAFCGLHSAGTGSVLSRFNTGISSNGLFTDDFSYDREGNPSTEYVEIDTENENKDGDVGVAMVNGDGEVSTFPLLVKRRQNIAVVPKYPNFPRDGETLLGNDVSVNTPDDELFVFPILERLGLGRFCSSEAIQERRVTGWNNVLTRSERVAVAVARAVAREATLVIVRDNLSQMDSSALRAEAYELLRDANCAVVATSSTLLEEMNKKNKNDEEFNEFEFVVSLSAGDKKEWKLNVDKGYLSHSAKKKARPMGDGYLNEDENSTILNSAGRAKRAPFDALQRRFAKKVITDEDSNIKRKLAL